MDYQADGQIFVEQDLTQGVIEGQIGVKVGGDGRIWICVNHQALIRFTPNIKENYDPQGTRKNYKGVR